MFCTTFVNEWKIVVFPSFSNIKIKINRVDENIFVLERNESKQETMLCRSHKKISVFAFTCRSCARHLMARNETRQEHKSPEKNLDTAICPLPEKYVVDLFADEGAQTEELAIDTV